MKLQEKHFLRVNHLLTLDLINQTHLNTSFMKTNAISRREFITRSGMATAGTTLGINALSARSLKKVGANDKIRMGFIGIGNRGSQLMNLFMANPEVQVAGLCDVYEPYRNPAPIPA